MNAAIKWLVLLGIAALAMAVRLPRLADRPMHTDETINASIVGGLLEGQPYTYDPQDRHGPALYAAALPIARLAGESTHAQLTERTLRLTPLLFGVLTVIALGLLFRPLGTGPVLAAAVLLALHPLAVFYGRDFIHETGFVFSSLLCLAALMRWPESKVFPVLAGFSAAAMLAFKETAVLAWAAMGAGVLATGLRCFRGTDRPLLRWMLAMLAGVATLILFFTWGGRQMDGPATLLQAIPRFFARAGGEGHEKPFFYFIRLLGGGWSGALFLVIAVGGGITAWRTRSVAWRMVNVHAAVTLLAYSAIPYKTPWLALNAVLPLALLAGHALAAVPRKRMSITLALLLLLCVAMGRDVRRTSFVYAADERNPYAYSQTTEDILRLPDVLRRLLPATKADGRDPVIAVVATDAWPMPWYLRTFPNVGYWQPGMDPGIDADAYITVTSDPLTGPVAAKLAAGWRPEYFGLRPNVLVILWTHQPAAIP